MAAVAPHQINLLVHSPRNLPVVAATFDEPSALFWAISKEGYIASYELPFGLKFSAWHVSVDDEVVELVPKGAFICIVRRDSIDVHQQGSLFVQSITSATLKNITCATDAPRTLNLLAGTADGSVLRVDTSQGTVIMQTDLGYGAITCIKCTKRMIAAGTRSGKVVLLDRRLLVDVETFDAGKGGVTSLAVAGNNLLLVLSEQEDGMPDPLIRVFDMKHKRVMHPIIQRGAPAIKAALLPPPPPPTGTANQPPPQLASVTTHGQLVLGGVGGGRSVVGRVALHMGQHRCTQVAVSPSAQVICVTDSGGAVHVVATCPNPTVGANPLVPPQLLDRNDLQAHADIGVDDYTKSLGFMLVQSSPLSSWELGTRRFARPHPRVPDAVLQTMRTAMNRNVGHCENIVNWRINQVQYPTKYLRQRGGRHRRYKDDDGDENETSSIVPFQYRKCDIKYNVRGLDGFDFERYNGTAHCGLEPDVPNSYCNALLQALFFNAPFRALCVQHHCEKDNCVACELGFLFQMMAKMAKTCQATNFLRCVRTSIEAKNLPLLVPDNPRAGHNIHTTIRSWLTFIFSQVEDVSVDPPVLSVHHAGAADTAASTNSSGDDRGAPKGNTGPHKGKAAHGAAAAAAPSFKEQFNVATTDTTDCLSCHTTAQSHKAAPVLVLHAPEALKKAVDAGAAAPDKSATTSSKTSTEGGGASGKGQGGVGQASSMASSSSTTANKAAARATPSDRDGAGAGATDDPFAAVSFEGMMEEALCHTQVLGAHCEKCGRFRKSRVTRRRRVTGPVLCLECPMTRTADKELWKAKAPMHKGELLTAEGDDHQSTPVSWIPWRVHIRQGGGGDSNKAEGEEGAGGDGQSNKKAGTQSTSAGRVVAETVTWGELPDAEATVLQHHHEQQQGADSGKSRSGVDDGGGVDGAGSAMYELTAAVFHVMDESGNQHAVSVVKVPHPYLRHRGIGLAAQWLIFNDFVVSLGSLRDALLFDTAWKSPCFLMYARPGHTSSFFDAAIPPVHAYRHRLLADRSLSHQMGPPSFHQLRPEDLPQEGDLVAIDAEFVSLRKQDAKIRSTQARKDIIKPAHLALARLSVVAGSGRLSGTPIIDDYVTMTEHVVDYVTKFSGIRESDLNPEVSTRHLTRLKATYSKVLYLAALGVRFVGHGLRKDFRVINVVLPPEQVHDTVDLFYKPDSRRLSLKFLAWYFLDTYTQQSDQHGHDSIEDSLTALKLYFKYRELSKNREDWLIILDTLYQEGAMFRWKVPSPPQPSPFVLRQAERRRHEQHQQQQHQQEPPQQQQPPMQQQHQQQQQQLQPMQQQQQQHDIMYAHHQQQWQQHLHPQQQQQQQQQQVRQPYVQQPLLPIPQQQAMFNQQQQMPQQQQQQHPQARPGMFMQGSASQTPPRPPPQMLQQQQQPQQAHMRMPSGQRAAQHQQQAEQPGSKAAATAPTPANPPSTSTSISTVRAASTPATAAAVSQDTMHPPVPTSLTARRMRAPSNARMARSQPPMDSIAVSAAPNTSANNNTSDTAGGDRTNVPNSATMTTSTPTTSSVSTAPSSVPPPSAPLSSTAGLRPLVPRGMVAHGGSDANPYGMLRRPLRAAVSRGGGHVATRGGMRGGTLPRARYPPPQAHTLAAPQLSSGSAANNAHAPTSSAAAMGMATGAAVMRMPPPQAPFRPPPRMQPPPPAQQLLQLRQQQQLQQQQHQQLQQQQQQQQRPRGPGN